MRHAFTLVELLIVVAVIAVLSVIVILILNPAEILRQTRDSNRISDLSTLKTALSFYEAQGGSSLGNASTSYVSIFDPTATSSAGDQCQGIGLPSLPGGWTYHCAVSSTFKNIDGTGWVPVNFSASQLKPPISQLPVDPVNTSSTGYYFTYTTNGGTYELTASLESQKDATLRAVDGGLYSDLYESGSNLALTPFDYATSSSGGGGGGHNGYAFARTITMSGSAVSGTLSNFPILFSGTYRYLAASSSAGNVQNPNGYDIVFASDSGCSSMLNFEQESYTSSTGNIIDWVNVPSITGGTAIYLCYGNASTTTNQQNVAGTWDSNYVGVWHFPNGTTLTTNDSTSNTNNGTNHNASAQPGQINGSAGFYQPNSQYIDMGTNKTSLQPSGAVTVETWIQPSSPTQVNQAGIVSQDYSEPRGSPFISYKLGLNNNNNGNYEFEISTNNNTDQVVNSGVAFANAVWAHVVATYDGSSAKIYINGVLKSTVGVSGNISYTSTGGFHISGNTDAAELITGNVDETRVSVTARSSQWILTEYNNENSPSTFYSVGSAM